MNFIKAYLIGLKTAITYPRVLLTTYLVNLLTAFVFFIVAYSSFNSLKVRSGAFENLLQRFDFTSVTDAISNYPDIISALPKLVIALGIFYWVLNVFLTGGILSSLRLEKFSMRNFFGGAGYNFFPFLLVDLIALVIFGGLAIALAAFSGWLLAEFKPTTELNRFWVLLGPMIAGVFLALMAIATTTYAKSMLVLNQSVNFLFYILKAFFFTLARFYVSFPLIVLLVIPPLGVAWLYFYLQGFTHSGGYSAILIGFAIQQVFILLRIFFRIWLLSSHFEFYDRQYYQKKLAAAAAKLAGKSIAEEVAEA